METTDIFREAQLTTGDAAKLAEVELALQGTRPPGTHDDLMDAIRFSFGAAAAAAVVRGVGFSKITVA